MSDDINTQQKDPALRGKVKRNLQIWLAGIIGVCALVIITYQTLFPSKPKPKKPAAAQEAPPAPELSALKAAIEQQKQMADKKRLESGAPGTPQPGSLDAPPKPVPLLPLPGMGAPLAGPAPAAAGAGDDDRRRAREAAEVEIRSSRILAQLEGGGTAAAAPATAADAPAAAGAQGGVLLPPAPGAAPAAERNAQADAARTKQQWFDNQGVHKTGPLSADPPQSPYTVFQGSVLPAVLVTQINSSLPGMVTAQITQDVYDGVNGRTLVIPQGSKLVGHYDSDVRYGQERIQIAFDRIIYPSGASVWLAGAPGADGLGQSGFEDQSSGHLMKMFATSMLMAAITYNLDKRENQNNPNSVYVVVGSSSVPATSASGAIMMNATNRILDRMEAAAQTIVIRQGYRFNVMVNRDMVLPPPDTARRW